MEEATEVVVVFFAFSLLSFDVVVGFRCGRGIPVMLVAPSAFAAQVSWMAQASRYVCFSDG